MIIQAIRNTKNTSSSTSTRMNISSKDEKHINRAVNECFKSPMLMKHGCIVASGTKVLSTGHNHYRTQFGDNFITTSCSCHAEMDGLRKVINAMTNPRSFKFHKKVGPRFEKEP